MSAEPTSRRVEFFGLSTDTVVDPTAVGRRTAADYCVELLEKNGVAPQDGDILAVSSKIAAFHEGGAVRLADIRPSRKARLLGRLFRKDPRKLQVLMETGRVILVVPMCWIVRIRKMWDAIAATSSNPEAMRRAFLRNNAFAFMVNVHANYLDDAGIDYSNAPEGIIATLPKDPCAVAARIRAAVRERLGADVAVVITDTALKLGRIGSNDVAIGYAGMDPITRLTFSNDLYGVPRSGGVDVVIDSIAATAGLVMGQTTEMTPAVLVRGVAYAPERAGAESSRMGELVYPEGTMGRLTLLTLAATALFHVADFFTFQRWPRRTRA
jgi:coenzyme F420-0:L-glutamate ligase / coenzyme F420-1:gamma-L-glutamate ligase